jgi:hypothetical protein
MIDRARILVDPRRERNPERPRAALPRGLGLG